MHAPWGGQLGEGPPLSGINSRGRRGARQAEEAAGAGPEEGVERRPGTGSTRPEGLGDSGRLSGRADSGHRAAHALAGALRSRVPSSRLRPRAQGKEGRGVPPSPEGRRASRPGAVRPPLVVTSLSLRRPSWVLFGALELGAGGPQGLGPSAIPAATPPRAGPGSPPQPRFSPPPGSSRNPAPGTLGEEAGGLPPSPGVGRKHPLTVFPSSLQRFPG